MLFLILPAIISCLRLFCDLIVRRLVVVGFGLLLIGCLLCYLLWRFVWFVALLRFLTVIFGFS